MTLSAECLCTKQGDFSAFGHEIWDSSQQGTLFQCIAFQLLLCVGKTKEWLIFPGLLFLPLSSAKYHIVWIVIKSQKNLKIKWALFKLSHILTSMIMVSQNIWYLEGGAPLYLISTPFSSFKIFYWTIN